MTNHRKKSAALFDGSWDYIINALQFFLVECETGEPDPESYGDIKRGESILEELKQIFPDKFPNEKGEYR